MDSADPKEAVSGRGRWEVGAKRGRGGGSQQHQHRVVCSVDGCESDLSKCKDYHRRHKVCEAHSKSPVVLVGGHQQRFCQQCSRFQLLGEFDEAKRSCRKRLDGHNRRRRKPQPVSASSALVPSTQGSGFYSCTQVFSVGMTLHPKSHASAKNEENFLFKSHSMLHFDKGQQQDISSSYRAKQFPLLQVNSVTTNARRTTVGSPSFQTPDTISSSECLNGAPNKTLPLGSTQDFISLSAPSLLSSSTRTPTNDLYHANQTPFVQLSTSLSKYSCSEAPNCSTAFPCLDVDHESAGAVLVPDSSSVLSSSSVVNLERDGLPDVPFQAVPFSWS